MPIEEFPGRTGVRLIPRLPVTDRSYAMILLDGPQGTYNVLASYRGGQSNGYPVLSPIMTSLQSDIAEQIKQERDKIIAQSSRYLDESRYPLPEFASTHAVARDTIEQIQAVVPVFSSIKYRESLQIVLPCGFLTRRYRLGHITGWAIFNA